MLGVLAVLQSVAALDELWACSEAQAAAVVERVADLGEGARLVSDVLCAAPRDRYARALMVEYGSDDATALAMAQLIAERAALRAMMVAAGLKPAD